MNPVKYYFDEHMPKHLAQQLTEEGIEVIRAVEVGMVDKDDDTEHLPYSTELGAVLVTQDKPFARRTMDRFDYDHAGLICWNGNQTDYGGMIKMLRQFYAEHTAESARGQVFWRK